MVPKLLGIIPAPQTFNEAFNTGRIGSSFFASHLLVQRRERGHIESQVEEQRFTRNRHHRRRNFGNPWLTSDEARVFEVLVQTVDERLLSGSTFSWRS